MVAFFEHGEHGHFAAPIVRDVIKAYFDKKARLAALKLASEKRRSGIEDANLAEAIAKMNQADTSYRAALGAVSSAERLSLLDYLK